MTRATWHRIHLAAELAIILALAALVAYVAANIDKL